MPKQYEFRYTVTGRGGFPVDMLRYDRATPRREEDSSLITSTLQHTHSRPPNGPEIQLCSRIKPPTEGRWVSFGWGVLGKVDKVEV